MSASKSTTVRFAPGSIQQNPMDRRQRLLRSTFERLEVSAPSLSARLAARVWFPWPRPP
jgi:hypothetical protein